MSGIIWVLFIVVPLEEVFMLRVFYHYTTESKSVLFIIIQIIGGLLLLSGTFIAIFGRISRWKRATSWGIPHQLETKGIYGWIRHPLYTSYICYFVGFPFLLLNVFLLPLLLGIPGYYYLSIYEENILLTHFPIEYSQYQKRVKRFIPFIW
jgi:protein-S-isoprenylcysteine O-methyltransferase Ste14